MTDYNVLYGFCVKAYAENEKRIVRYQRRGRVIPDAFLQYRQLFDTKKWTIRQDSLLYRIFFGKEFDDDRRLIFSGNLAGDIQSVSILHKFNKVVVCEVAFSLNRRDFPNMFALHENYVREKKAKLLLYPVSGNTEIIDKYLARKSTSKLKRLKKYDKLEGKYSIVYYLKLAKKETFMTLMKEILHD